MVYIYIYIYIYRTNSGRLIGTGSNDKTIKLLVCPSLKEENFQERGIESDEVLEMGLSGHKSTVRTICFDRKSDEYLYSGGVADNGNILVWNTETGTLVTTINGHKGAAVQSLQIISDSNTLVSVGTDNYIRGWDIRIKPQPTTNTPGIFNINTFGYANINHLALNPDIIRVYIYIYIYNIYTHIYI